MVSMLETQPSDMFYISTIFQANCWKIMVHPVGHPTNDPIRALTYACLNADIFGTDIELGEVSGWVDWLLDRNNDYIILNSASLLIGDSDREWLRAYAEENFLLRVLPMWSFMDAPADLCLILRGLDSTFLRENFTPTYPFQFYRPDTHISNLQSDNPGSVQRLMAATEAVYSRFRSTRASSCWLTSPTARVTNVNEYVNLRRQPDFSARVIRQAPLGEQVRPLRFDNLSVIGQERDRQSCINACQAFGANSKDRSARDRVQQCIDDNMLWYEITDARGNRGWVSRKFLEEVE